MSGHSSLKRILGFRFSLTLKYEADCDRERYTPKAGPDAVYVVNISGIGDGEVMNGLQVAKKSGIPQARGFS